MNAIIIVLMLSTLTAAKLGEVMSNSVTFSTTFIEICCSPFMGISCVVCILFLGINYIMALSSDSTSARKEAKISIVFIIAIVLFLTSTRILRWKTQENSQYIYTVSDGGRKYTLDEKKNKVKIEKGWVSFFDDEGQFHTVPINTGYPIFNVVKQPKSTTTGSSASSSYLSSLSTEELQKRHDRLLFVYDNKITNMPRDDFFDFLAIRDELQKRASGEEVNGK